jgi:electron transport complex protein RnfB
VNPLAQRIHSALPQTQCTRCGYPDCASYAQAVSGREAQINQCPPGGTEGIARLAAITGQPVLALNPENGREGPRFVAVIDEAWCIGCTLCLPACPTDAIIGSNRRMHTVIESACTGCELCVAVCPVDCISLENVTGQRSGWQAWSQRQADEALRRYKAQRARTRSENDASVPPSLEETTPQTPVDPFGQSPGTGDEAARKRAVIEAALARSRARRQQP